MVKGKNEENEKRKERNKKKRKSNLDDEEEHTLDRANGQMFAIERPNEEIEAEI